MTKLLKTIASIFSAKTRKLNRALQISACIDLVDSHQVRLAKAYKNLTKTINDLHCKLVDIKRKAASLENSTAADVYMKNAEVIETTLNRLKKSKETIANKLQKSEDSKTILVAKKSLLDSIESLKGLTSNKFDGQDFDIDLIMDEIDKSIRDIESEFQADDELNSLANK